VIQVSREKVIVLFVLFRVLAVFIFHSRGRSALLMGVSVRTSAQGLCGVLVVCCRSSLAFLESIEKLHNELMLVIGVLD
jgi:branched-subunit amino acid transport protein AzlD